jgi:hypothetical protein
VHAEKRIHGLGGVFLCKKKKTMLFRHPCFFNETLVL